MERQQYIIAVERYGNTVYRVAYQYCGNRSDAEDIVQNVFWKLLQAKKSFEDEEYLRRWLIRVAVNEAKNLSMSFWKRRVLPLEESESQAAYEMPTNEHSILYEAVMQLSPKYRIVVHLYYFEGYSVKEMAKLLRIRETTIQTRLMRARAKLKEVLENE
ncbi:MAG: sigma-70 family RNA polymerase sigma factor [Lachnospiraceae bacterium]|nr:sigma-70 family RNA polymerase sigma factor [Lachnospiraceae bacterium]